MRSQKAFTLVELLVVIAIIAVLMAILMPSLRAVREQAKKTVCTAHVRGLMLSMRMYVDDNEGATAPAPNQGLWDNGWQNPPRIIRYGPYDSMAYWGIAYFPYGKNKKIFSCPSVKRVDDWPELGAPWGLPSQKYFEYCSYGINNYVCSKLLSDGTIIPKKIDHEFKHQAEVIAFQDHIEQRLDGIGSDMFCIGPNDSINLTQWRPSSQGGTGFVDSYWSGDQWHDTVQECFRHRGVSMTSWLDGHVSEIKETTGEDVPQKWYLGK